MSLAPLWPSPLLAGAAAARSSPQRAGHSSSPQSSSAGQLMLVAVAVRLAVRVCRVCALAARLSARLSLCVRVCVLLCFWRASGARITHWPPLATSRLARPAHLAAASQPSAPVARGRLRRPPSGEVTLRRLGPPPAASKATAHRIIAAIIIIELTHHYWPPTWTGRSISACMWLAGAVHES